MKRRALSRDEKLRQQLLGKRAAHFKKNRPGQLVAPSSPIQSRPLKHHLQEGSDDDEGGRAAQIESKSRKGDDQKTTTEKAGNDGSSALRTSEAGAGAEGLTNGTTKKFGKDVATEAVRSRASSKTSIKQSSSFLDEVLRARLKKKKRKTQPIEGNGREA